MLKIRFSNNQWKKVSEISGNIGLLATGSVVIPALFDKPDLENILLGLVAASISWALSLYAAKRY